MKKLLTILMLFFVMLLFHQAQGQIVVSGNVYEQDSISPIAGVSVRFTGVDAIGDTVVYQFITDTFGHYEDNISYGKYVVSACAEGYECSYLTDSLLIECDSLRFEYDSLLVVYDSLTGIYDSIYLVYNSLTEQYDTVYFVMNTLISGVDLVLYEIRYPVHYVAASPYAGDLVRISWSMYDSLRYEDRGSHLRSFRYYEVFRRGEDGAPVLLASHLTDTVFMETHWGNLPWGYYCWGVSCYYEGNRYASDTVWSAPLGKDMTTTLEVNITTNVGLSASSAVVTLLSHDGQGYSYQVVADDDGHVLMPDVYRDWYDLHVHLDGFVDYVSSEPLSVMEPQQTQVELMESMYAVDSLYVSFTGYAMWHLCESQIRDLQYYELRLNGQTVGSTTENAFQFDVSNLSPGQVCRAEVRSVFLSGASNWHALYWVFWPCSYLQGSDGGLQWSLTEDAVLLSWNNPQGMTVLGTYLFRNGEYLGFVEGNAYVDETVEMHGEVTYCIHFLYGGPMDGTYYSESCEECAVVSFPIYCGPPVKLEGENYWNSESDYGALISWGERPEPIYQWLHYDNGGYKQSLGGDNEPIIFWSIRFDATDLEAYAGASLKKISLFDVGAGIYQLWIYEGGETAPRSLVWSQIMTLSNTHDWHEETLDYAIEISGNEPLWIVVGQQGLNRPAAACLDMGNPNGRWVSLDGEHWSDLVNYNMHYTWMLRAYVTNRSGRMSPLDEGKSTLQHYNLYRSYNNVDYQQVAAIPANEGQIFYQYRDVLVSESHSAFYYRLSAVYLSDFGETCESDFAVSLYNPDAQYVYVDDCWLTQEKQSVVLKLYPNPSDGLVFIESEGMQEVVVYNALGQVLLRKEAYGDGLQFDLSGFENGLYWLRVSSPAGVMTRRFVLSR